jgi:hypothetical protein
MQQLALGRDRVAARDDLDGAVQAARAQSDKDIGGIVRQNGGERAGAIDASRLERSLIGGIALQTEMIRLARLGDAPLILFQHDEWRAAVLERLGKRDADTAEAADDDVTAELVDLVCTRLRPNSCRS